MQLFKILIMIMSVVFVIIAAWLYFSRDFTCENQSWWIVLVLGLLNIALTIILFTRRQNLEENRRQRGL